MANARGAATGGPGFQPFRLGSGRNSIGRELGRDPGGIWRGSRELVRAGLFRRRPMQQRSLASDFVADFVEA
jgi:hypothetical protein